jgi:methylthioribose-1-phosphate isomerase
MDIKSKLGFSHIEWRDDHLAVLDQRLLPNEETFIQIDSLQKTAESITNLTVRGAPLIGVTAAYGLCLLDDFNDKNHFLSSCDILKNARPTAVNLSWAVERMKKVFLDNFGKSDLHSILKAEAIFIHEEDSRMCDNIGRIGNTVIPSKCKILTHCNAGALATGGIGTALAVIYTAHFSGKEIEVWVDETRPVLQGARLTAWELAKAGVPFKLISDNVAASLMADAQVDLIVVGADRIAANYDFANKIGTYGLAVQAQFHNVPFYCAAPSTTYDPDCPDGASIPIERRDSVEVQSVLGKSIAPKSAKVFNPAFDVTPHNLVAGIITESEIVRPN